MTREQERQAAMEAAIFGAAAASLVAWCGSHASEEERAALLALSSGRHDWPLLQRVSRIARRYPDDLRRRMLDPGRPDES